MRELFDALAELCAYPGPDMDARIARACTAMAAVSGAPATGPAAVAAFERFAVTAGAMAPATLEEGYTGAFDVNPLATLDLGWHLYGEQYERGAFLVRMRDTLRRLAVEETTELPDHLTQALRAIGRMPEEEAALFAADVVRPAVEKILAGLAGKNVVYEDLLRAVLLLVPAASPVAPANSEHV